MNVRTTPLTFVIVLTTRSHYRASECNIRLSSAIIINLRCSCCLIIVLCSNVNANNFSVAACNDAFRLLLFKMEAFSDADVLPALCLCVCFSFDYFSYLRLSNYENTEIFGHLSGSIFLTIRNVEDFLDFYFVYF